MKSNWNLGEVTMEYDYEHKLSQNEVHAKIWKCTVDELEIKFAEQLDYL